MGARLQLRTPGCEQPSAAPAVRPRGAADGAGRDLPVRCPGPRCRRPRRARRSGRGRSGGGAREGALSYRAAMRVAVAWRQLSTQRPRLVGRRPSSRGLRRGLRPPDADAQRAAACGPVLSYCARALALARTLAAGSSRRTRGASGLAAGVAALHRRSGATLGSRRAVGKKGAARLPQGRPRKPRRAPRGHAARDRRQAAPRPRFSIRTPGTRRGGRRTSASSSAGARAWRGWPAARSANGTTPGRCPSSTTGSPAGRSPAGRRRRTAALFALLEAAGRRLVGPLPEGRRLDWEAIPRPDPDAFVEAVRDWLCTIGPSALDLDGLGRVAERFRPRAALQALSEGTEDARPLFDRDLVAMRAFEEEAVP